MAPPSHLGKRKHTEQIIKATANSGTPPLRFANAQEFRHAIRDAEPETAKEVLIAFRNQLTVKYDEPPVSATDARVKLAHEYLEKSPGAEEIFDAWDLAFTSGHALLLPLPLAAIASLLALLSPLSFFHPHLQPILTRLLSPTIIRSVAQYLAGTRTDLILVALKVLGEAVRVGERWAGRVWEALAGAGGVNAKVWGKLLAMKRKMSGAGAEAGGRPKKGSVGNPFATPDIRVLTLNFLLSLLLAPHLPTKLAILGQSSVVKAMFKPIIEDHPAVVQRLLQGWWEVWFLEKRIARGTKLSAFGADVVGEIVKLYTSSAASNKTTGPGEGEGYTSRELAHHFLVAILTKPGEGLCFKDQGWYPRGTESVDLLDDEDQGAGSKGRGGTAAAHTSGVHNKVIREVLRSIGSDGLVGDEDGVAQLVLKVLESCPELVAGYWASSGITLDPRLSSKFLISTAHLCSIVSLPIPTSTFLLPASNSAAPSTSSSVVAPTYRATPPPLTAIIENILPSIFPKQFSTKGLLSKHPLVQQTTAVTLSRCLAKLHAVLTTFQTIERTLEENPTKGAWAVRRSEVECEMRKRIPDVANIVGFALAVARQVSEATTSEESSRGAILTEAALRLLSLYHLTLPGLIAEARFDVGKLLVPGAAEGAGGGKGKAREEDGSSALAATTAGDGWGFARADLEGVEALSQLHVLRLVGEGGNFAWSSKAGSHSPHTYMYHLLRLYLATPHPATRSTTSALITRLLSSSVLFEHDPSEIAIWLTSLPAWAAVDGAARETLLDFLDDSIRRCIKTPYKYLEASLHFAPSPAGSLTPASATPPAEASSPLLMTLLEQFAAKVKAGLLVDHEQVALVAAYVRRLAFALVGKQTGLTYAREVARKLDETLRAAGEAGEEGKLGRELDLLETAGLGSEMEFDQASDPLAFDLSLLTSTADIRCQTRLVLHRVNGLLRLPREEAAKESKKSKKSSNPSSSLAGTRDDVSDALIRCVRLLETLVCARDVTTDIKRLILMDKAAMELLMLEKVSSELRSTIGAFIRAGFNPLSAADCEVTQAYQDWTTSVLASSSAKSLGKHASSVLPWIPFLEVSSLVANADAVLAALSFASSDKSRASLESLLGALFGALRSHPPTAATLALAQRSLPVLLPLGMLSTVVDLLDASLPPGHTASSAAIHAQRSIRDLTVAVDSTCSEAFNPVFSTVSGATAAATFGSDLLTGGSLSLDKAALFTPFIYQSGLARDIFGAWLKENLAGLAQADLESIVSPTAAFVEVAAVQENPSLSIPGWSTVVEALPRLIKTYLSSNDAKQAVALERSIALLAHGGDEASVVASLAVEGLPALDLPRLAPIFADLAVKGRKELIKPIDAYVDASLEWLVRKLSDTGSIDDATITLIKALAKLVRARPSGSLKAHLVEPVFTVILQDRMTCLPALELVPVCAAKTTMKPAVVVKQLQTLLANRNFSAFSSSSAEAVALRPVVVAAIRALFDMSPATCCQPAHIEPLMTLYRGTPDETDQTILSIFHLFERHRRISVGSLLVSWSPDGAFAVGANHQPLDIVASLDPIKVLKTCATFPASRSLDLQEIDPDTTEGVYDPVYILSVYAAVLVEGELGLGNELSGLDWVEVVRSNVLGLVICALSSRKADMREFASFLLSKTCYYINEIFFHEQAQILHTLNLLRHSCRPPTPPSTTPHRLSRLIALFFAHTLRAIGNPATFLYPAASRFLLQRPQLDAGDVPLIYSMLYSSDEDWKQERSWVLRFLRDGMRSAEDWRVLQRRHTFSLLASLFQSSPEASVRRSILEVTANMTANPTACVALVRYEGFLSWVGIQIGLFGIEERSSVGDKVVAAEAEGGARSLETAVAETDLVVLRLLENVTIHLGEEDRARAKGREDGVLSKVDWRGDVIGLVIRLLTGAPSLDSVHLASSILIRLSLLPVSLTAPTPDLPALLALVSSTLFTLETTLSSSSAASSPPARSTAWTSEDIYSAPSSTQAAGALWTSASENLWRTALSLGPAKVAKSLMERLSGRALAGPGELGPWVRREWLRVRAGELTGPF